MQRTTGTIISVKKQWWLKINKKPIRKGALDGAAFPYVIKVKYVVDGKEYIKRKWIGTEYPVPVEGAVIQLAYEENCRAVALSSVRNLCGFVSKLPAAQLLHPAPLVGTCKFSLNKIAARWPVKAVAKFYFIDK